MSEAFPNCDAPKKLAKRDPEAFRRLEAEILNELERRWPELKQPFTDDLMDEILRGMSDAELDDLARR